MQLDGQEQPSVETEQRRIIVEAVRKFSSLTKNSASRAVKPFFPVLTKTPKPALRPWPSVTNIQRPAQISSIPTPAIPTTVVEIEDPWAKDSFKSLHRQPSIDSEGRPSVSSQSEKNQEGVINSAFAEERMNNTSNICDCDDAEEDDDDTWYGPSHRSRCTRVSCQQSFTSETIDMSVISDEPISLSGIKSSSKYFITRRDRSISDSRKKKSILRTRLSGKLSNRRRTTDSIPTMSTILSQTWSSPNLSNLEEQTKTAQNVKVGSSSCKQEENQEDSKL